MWLQTVSQFWHCDYYRCGCNSDGKLVFCFNCVWVPSLWRWTCFGSNPVNANFMQVLALLLWLGSLLQATDLFKEKKKIPLFKYFFFSSTSKDVLMSFLFFTFQRFPGWCIVLQLRARKQPMVAHLMESAGPWLLTAVCRQAYTHHLWHTPLLKFNLTLQGHSVVGESPQKVTVRRRKKMLRCWGGNSPAETRRMGC